MRVAIASIAFGAICLVLGAGPGGAQNPPVPAPTGPVNPPAPTPTPLAAPPATPSASPAASPPPGANAPAPVSPPPAGTPIAVPTTSAAPVPIIADPPALGVSPGGTTSLRVTGVYGSLVAKLADATVAAINAVDQNARTVVVAGLAPGATTLTLSDDRGQTRDVPLRVAYVAGNLADETSIRITGNPASGRFVQNAAALAATRAARLRPGANVAIDPGAVQGAKDLPVGDLLAVSVPLQINGAEYFSALGSTRVKLENVALPRIRPSQLLVSDYPEQLKENGVLFTAQLDRRAPQRFLYYHYNPPGSPERRIILRAENPSKAPALVQFISGEAGPEPNEMEVGHLSTLRFLVREAQNEGLVLTIPPNSSVNLVDQRMPPQNVVSNLLQLREVEGDPIKLTLVAQDANEPADKPISSTDLLESDVKHARGVYRVPEFYFDYVYYVDSNEPLEIPIGQLPLPNLREGQALAGDYGVMQSVTVTIVNPTDYPAPIALYQNPRGGRATGTYLIDRTLVQSHAAQPFSKFKLRQYRVPPHATFRVSIVTMPKGGSSYPVRLIFAPDDGSVSPGAPGSPVY
ncbi:MAG: hypothetical protein JO359_08640 [Candidatus Eremiobacteraeota bacterium]|nr:hypothetical protein [Candidatus Eremiobacteraeota bacterium]